jgi:hypothetical protein
VPTWAVARLLPALACGGRGRGRGAGQGGSQRSGQQGPQLRLLGQLCKEGAGQVLQEEGMRVLGCWVCRKGVKQPILNPKKPCIVHNLKNRK